MYLSATNSSAYKYPGGGPVGPDTPFLISFNGKYVDKTTCSDGFHRDSSSGQIKCIPGEGATEGLADQDWNAHEAATMTYRKVSGFKGAPSNKKSFRLPPIHSVLKKPVPSANKIGVKNTQKLSGISLSISGIPWLLILASAGAAYYFYRKR